MYVLEIGVKCLMLQGNILSFSFSITKPSQMKLFNHIPWRNLRRKLLPNRQTWMSSRRLCLLTPPGRMGRMAARVMMATVLTMRNPVILLRWGGYLSYASSSTNQFVGSLGVPINLNFFFGMVLIHFPFCFVFLPIPGRNLMALVGPRDSPTNRRLKAFKSLCPRCPQEIC